MPADIAALKRRWLGLMPATGGEPARVIVEFEKLIAAYSGSERHYHNLDHVAALFALFDAEAARFADPGCVQLAIFFHDAVYDTRQPKGNEQDSADLAWDTLRQLNFRRERYERVAKLIEETVHSGMAPADDPDLSRFLDLDLSILAAEWRDYAVYASAIRKEYAAVAEPAYRTGRTKVLAGFLKRDRLFHCDDHHVAWDARARENLAREIAELESRAP